MTIPRIKKRAMTIRGFLGRHRKATIVVIIFLLILLLAGVRVSKQQKTQLANRTSAKIPATTQVQPALTPTTVAVKPPVSSIKPPSRTETKAKAKPQISRSETAVSKPAAAIISKPKSSAPNQEPVVDRQPERLNDLLEQLVNQGITVRLADKQTQIQKPEEKKADSACDCSEDTEFLTDEELAERFKEEVRRGRVP